MFENKDLKILLFLIIMFENKISLNYYYLLIFIDIKNNI